MKFSKSKIFLFCLICFIVGIGLASFFPANYLKNDLFWFIASLSCCLLLAAFWHKPKIKLMSLLALFLFLGIWRYAISSPTITPDKISYYNGQKINFVGRIIREPDVRDKSQKLKIAGISLDNKRELYGAALITANRYPEYNYGDQLQIKCKLQAPEKFNDFAYDRYLARYDIYSVCYYPSIKKLEKNEGHKWLAAIYNFKNIVRNQINRNLAEPQSSLAAGMLLGDMRSADENLKLVFSRSGLSHITAVSGMNISILVSVAMAVLLFFGFSRRQSFYISIFLLVAFIVLVGMPASAVRAGVMGFLALLALNIGRLNRITNALFLTAVILLFFNPKLLRDDIGFQLSFLAVLGIVYVYPLFNIYLNKIKTPCIKIIGDVLAITVSAQVFTTPIIAYNFSIISLVAPLSNLLVLWCITFLTVGLMIILLLSFVLPVSAWYFFLPADLLLRYIIKVAEASAGLPLAYVEVGNLSWAWLAIYYFTFGFLVVYFNKRYINADDLIYS